MDIAENQAANQAALDAAVGNLRSSETMKFYLALVSALMVVTPTEIFSEALSIARMAAPLIDLDFKPGELIQ